MRSAELSEDPKDPRCLEWKTLVFTVGFQDFRIQDPLEDDGKV